MASVGWPLLTMLCLSCEGPELGVSSVGIFKTLPAEDDSVTLLKLAFFSWYAPESLSEIKQLMHAATAQTCLSGKQPSGWTAKTLID